MKWWQEALTKGVLFIGILLCMWWQATGFTRERIYFAGLGLALVAMVLRIAFEPRGKG